MLAECRMAKRKYQQHLQRLGSVETALQRQIQRQQMLTELPTVAECTVEDIDEAVLAYTGCNSCLYITVGQSSGSHDF